MTRISAIGVRHLRTLFDISPPIELAPITILLGKNSVGKSTFARLLPLLRQSVERRKRAPILWFDELVDFGTINQAITRGESELDLIIKIDEVTTKNARSDVELWGDYRSANPINLRNVLVTLRLAAEEGSGATYAKELQLEVAGSSIQLKFSGRELNSIAIRGIERKWPTEKIKAISDQGALLPRINFVERKKPDAPEWYWIPSPFRTAIVDYLHRHVHQNTSKGTMANIANRLPVADGLTVAKAVAETSGPPTWLAARQIFSTKHPSVLNSLVDALLLANLGPLIERIDEIISAEAKGFRYLKPLRATAERYYRRADLDVAEIDPEGRNLAVFLDALGAYQLQNFRKWLQENFGLDVEPKREGAQVLLLAKSASDTESSNVADMGFGISQVLPIAAQLWASSSGAFPGRSAPRSSVVMIEQPELHLHPAFQARLADVFAGVVTQPTRPGAPPKPRIVAETHSQHLVNRLGLLIEQQRLKSDDVSIVLFEPNESRPGTSTARVCRFDSDGVLEDWPFGFFEPEV